VELFVIWRSGKPFLKYEESYVLVESEVPPGRDLLTVLAFRWLEKKREKDLRADYIEAKVYSIPPYLYIDDGVERKVEKYKMEVREVLADGRGALYEIELERVNAEVGETPAETPLQTSE